jgi:CDP-paratose 2-epimerase
MKILLTGHEGYLGSCLHLNFVKRGHVVIGFGREQDITTIDRSILDENQIELVINCATAADRIGTIYNPGGADERVNVFGTRRLVEALKGTGIGLIHISTKDIYGPVYNQRDVTETSTRLIPAFTIDESQPFRPQTVYAKTKLMGEFITESHPKTTVVRLSSGYTTAVHKKGNWILHFCRAAKNGTPVCIQGTGKQLRDPLHVDDLGALLLLIQERNAWGYKLNAGGGLNLSHSIMEVLDMIDPRHPRTFFPGGDWGYVTDNSFAEKLVGWKPQRSLSAEIHTLIKCVRNE